jgi:hypothetical protein
LTQEPSPRAAICNCQEDLQFGHLKHYVETVGTKLIPSPLNCVIKSSLLFLDSVITKSPIDSRNSEGPTPEHSR